MNTNSPVQPVKALRYGVAAAGGLTFGAAAAALSVLLLAVATL